MFVSRFLPCEECGESVERSAAESHVCDSDRRVEFVVFGLQGEIAAFETRFQEYLSSPTGYFDAWLAAREVRASA